MKSFKTIVLIALVAACTSGIQTEQKGSALASTEDYFENKIVVELAQHFMVSYHGNYKVVKLTGEFARNSDKEVRQDKLVLVQNGTPAPQLVNDLADAHVISIPVESVAVNVQHSESFLRELDLVERLVAVGGVVSYDDRVRQMAIEGKLGQVGYSWHSPPNAEVLLARNPDLFLMTYADLNHTIALDKCRELGIPTAPVFDWAEDNYLARAEWIKFYSLFFNAELKANQVFEEIKSTIADLKNRIREHNISESIMWAFYVDKGRWVVRLTTDEVLFSTEVGMRYPLADKLLPNQLGTQTVSTEELIEKASDIDHWFIGDIHSSKLPPEYIMKSFKSWRTGKLYHNMKRGKPEVNASDWYATGLTRPDYILADMVKLLYPELLPDHQLFFMDVFDKKTEFPILKSMR